MRARVRHVAALLGMLVLVAACGDAGRSVDAGSGASAGPVGPEGLLGTAEWVLVAGEVDGAAVEVPAGSEVTLQLAPEGVDGQVAGTSGCNRYSTVMTVDGAAVQVREEIASTMMACGEDVMALERTFLLALPRATSGERDGERLVLSGGGVSLTFAPRSTAAPVPTADAAGGARELLGDASWHLVEGEVDGQALTVPPGHPVTLVASVEGTPDEVGGTSACNHYGTRMTVTDETVSVSPELSGTAMDCGDAASAVETRYLQALPRLTAARRDGAVLVLSGAGVLLRFEAQPALPTDALVGTPWQLEALLSDDVAASVGGEPATLLLAEDGTMTGSTGCRTLSGEYVVRGDEVVLWSLAAEGEDCPEELAEQDGHVVEVLGDGFRAAAADGTLTLTSSRGMRGLVYRAG